MCITVQIQCSTVLAVGILLYRLVSNCICVHYNTDTIQHSIQNTILRQLDRLIEIGNVPLIVRQRDRPIEIGNVPI